MRKIVPVLAVLGSAVAFAVYKMKKEEQKELMELDEGLLKDEDLDFHRSETIVHEPIQNDEPVVEQEQPVNFFKEEKPVETPIAKEIEPEFAPSDKAVEMPVNDEEVPVSDIEQLLQEAADEALTPQEDDFAEIPVIPAARVKSPEEDRIDPDYLKEKQPVFIQEESQEEETYSPEFPHLTNRMVDDIKVMTKDAIAALAADGDVHEHERPVQHMVSFRNKEDMESFKSKVINRGFVITKGEEEFDLVVLHISAIDEVKLVNNILYLADQAYAFNGEYRGWQSKVSF